MERAEALVDDPGGRRRGAERRARRRSPRTARFKEDLDADSLDLVELVMGLEERFDIEVPEDDLEASTTVGQAVDLVLAKVGGQGDDG